MTLVGDLIVKARNNANDPCQTLGTPTAPTAVASSTAGIFSGTVYGIITYLNQWGETVGSSEFGPITCASKALALSAMVPPYAATAARLYWGYASGAELQYIAFSPTATATVGATGATVLSGAPPYKSSAYLPDTDGDIVSTYDMYRWLNDGLQRLGRLAGGILDQTGVAMQAGAAEVVIPGWWLSIKYVWHNGWLTLPETQSYTWLQSPVQGIPGISTLWRNGAQQVLGAWPQPSTPAATTALTSDMSATDYIANVLDTNALDGTDGAMTLNSNVLNSAVGGFGASMVGLTITITGAGAGATDLVTTIQNYVTYNEVTVNQPALTAVTNANFAVDGTGAPNFTAPGMCQIDAEIMSYSQTSATQLTGIVRGYGGTQAVAHSAGAVVSQLILRFLGRRMPAPLSPGQSADTLDLPQGWAECMALYLLSQFKQTEQNVQEAATLIQEFDAKAIELRDDQIPLESKQIGGLWPLGGAAQSLADVMDTVIVE